MPKQAVKFVEDPRQFWEVLVPTVRNNGRPIRTRFHNVWDAGVEKICGGMTIYHPAKGSWLHEDKQYKERMIPVRVLATDEQIRRVVAFTAEYYDQIEVLAYRVSDKILRCRKA